MANKAVKKRNTTLIWIGVVVLILGTMTRSSITDDGGMTFGYALFILGIAMVLVGIFTKKKSKKYKD